MQQPLVVVTGKNGQLGWELMQASAQVQGLNFVFTGRDELDMADLTSIDRFFEQYQPVYFIHCAAYTAVDQAETDQETAYQVNAMAVGHIAMHCKKNGASFILLSTDYVFNGNGTKPYLPDDLTDPVNYYGYTKWIGEELALKNNPATIVIRTSWVYSSHGNNFVKTMLRLMKERESVNVVADQAGSPTYAADLAQTILLMLQQMEKGNHQYGVFHYSNTGTTTWFDFAINIRDQAGLSCVVHPISTVQYPTPAKRPAYSVMDLSKIGRLYAIYPPVWQDALQRCLQQLLP